MEEKSDKKSDKKQNLGMLAIVAIVAIVSLVVLFNQKQAAVAPADLGADEELLGQALEDEESLLGEAFASSGPKPRTITNISYYRLEIEKKKDLVVGQPIVNLYLNQIIKNPSGTRDSEWCVTTTSDNINHIYDIVMTQFMSQWGEFVTEGYSRKIAGIPIEGKSGDDVKITPNKVTARLETSDGKDGFCVRMRDSKAVVDAGKEPALRFEVSVVVTPKTQTEMKKGKPKKTVVGYKWLSYVVYIGDSPTPNCQATTESRASKCTFSNIKAVLPPVVVAPECPNGVVDAGEACDGTAFGSVDGCADISAYTDGTLICTADCKLDISGCN